MNEFQRRVIFIYGHIALIASNLEFILAQLICRLVTADFLEKHEKMDRTISDMTMGQKLNVLMSIKDEDVVDSMKITLKEFKEIDSKYNLRNLKEERNRYIHDLWVLKEKSPVVRIKPEKESAGGINYMPLNDKEIDLEQMKGFRDTICHAFEEIISIVPNKIAKEHFELAKVIHKETLNVK